MKNHLLFKSSLAAVALLVGAQIPVQGQTTNYSPIAITPSSYTFNIVVPVGTPLPVVNAYVGSGLCLTCDTTFFEQGLAGKPGQPGDNAGLPPHNTVFTNINNSNMLFLMPADYFTNDDLMIVDNTASNSDYGALSNGTLTFVTPTTATNLAILCTGGNGGAEVNYIVTHADSSTDTGTFSVPDWFHGGPQVAWGNNGRYNGGGFQNFNASKTNNQAPYLYATNLTVSGASPVTGIEFDWVTNGGVDNFFAVSGNASGSTWTPIPVTGFNVMAIEQAVAFPAITATYDAATNINGGDDNPGNTWFEVGLDSAAPTNGIPASGSTFTSASFSTHTYKMGNYASNNAILIDADQLSANIVPATPASYSAISFLTSGGNGGGVNTAVIQHADGVNETNEYTVYDWFTGAPQLPAWIANGRITMNSRTFQNIGSGNPKLFESYFILADRTSPVTNIALSYVSGGGDTMLMAVSGAAANAIGPIFTSQLVNSVAIAGENFTLNSTAIGLQPLTYQWTSNGVVVAGATGPTLTITNVPLSASGSTFFCTVTDPNTLAATSATITLTVVPNLGGSYFSTLVGLNPLGYWPLNETNQPAAFQGYAQNIGTLGSAANAVYDNVTGYQEQGLLGDLNPLDTNFCIEVSASEVQAPYSLAFSNAPPFTVELWLQSFAPATADGCAISCVDAGSTRSGWLIYMDADAAGVYQFRAYNENAGNTSVALDAGSAVGASETHYLVVVVNTNSGAVPNAAGVYPTNSITASIYLDGQLSSSGVGSPAADPGAYAPDDGGDGGGFAMGNRGDNAFPFTGEIDEVAYYPTALSATTISNHYAVGTNTAPSTPYYQVVLASAPLVFYQLDEAAPNYEGETGEPVATNYGVNGVNDDGYYLPGSFPGSVAGPGVFGLPGPNVAVDFNHLFGFDPAAGYVDVPAQDLNITGPITMTAWIKPVPNDDRFQTFAGHSDSGYRMDIDTGMDLHFADANSAGDLTGGAINDGNWHFVAGTWDGTNEYLYIDGLQNATQPATGTATGSPDDFTIGVDPQYEGSRNFDGAVSQVALFDYALTGKQIQDLYFAAEVPPRITQQPPATQTLGDTASGTITAAAYGSPTLIYQWYEGTSPVSGAQYSGATTPALTISNAAPSDDGTYTLVVTNAFGAVTSSPTVISVSQFPVISPGLAPLTHVATAGTITLSVGEIGTPPFTNAWYLNGVLLTDGGLVSGATTTTLVISNASPSDVGTYVFWATNAFGTASSSGTVVVDSEPTFDNNGAGWTVNDNGVDAGQGAIVNDVITMTDGKGSEVTSFFYDTPVYIHAFQASWTYEDVGGAGGANTTADGFTFCVQNTGAGANALAPSSSGGSGLGYVYAITNSVELCTELYNNNGDNAPGIDVATNGQPSLGVLNPGGYLFGSTGTVLVTSGDPINYSVYYDGSNYSVTLTDATTTDTFSTNYVIGAIWETNIIGSDTAYVGFTAATGGVSSTQPISNFYFTPLIPISAVTSPGSVTLSWPTAVGGYVLQVSPSLSQPDWTTVPGPYPIVGNQYQYVASTAVGTAFYRLAVSP